MCPVHSLTSGGDHHHLCPTPPAHLNPQPDVLLSPGVLRHRLSTALREIENVLVDIDRPSVIDTADFQGQALAISSRLGGKEYVNIFDTLITLQGPSVQVLKTVCVIMQSYVKKNILINENLYPAELYVKDQVNLFLLSILLEVKKRYITCGLFREGFENLYYMASYMYGVENQIATLVATELCNVIVILEDIANLAETFSGVSVTNYKKVKEYIKTQYPETATDRSIYYGKVKYFRIEKLLGAGGFGAVYQASIAGVECAMKHVPLRLLPDPENSTVDKKVASLINHICLVNYFACFCTQESYVTVMEFIRGVDVIKLLRECRKLPKELVKIVIAQVGLALQHMHYKGFIHRDVKPSNIMISRGCRVKLFDFDTAKVCYGKHHKKYMFYFSRRTSGEFKDGEIAGTLSYMAPEVFSKDFYGRATDWFSLGVTAYELATGRLPFRFEDKEFDEQKEIIRKGRYSWPKDHVDYVLQVFVDYCLRPKQHRLCTKRYLELLFHPYFENVSWEHVENGQALMDFEPLNAMIANSFDEPGSSSSCCVADQPASESDNLEKIVALFGWPSPQFHDTVGQKPMFVYSSMEFRKLIESIKKKQSHAMETLYRPLERVYTTENREDYEFEGF
ncbi:serine/threonine-protein kinase orb6-like [Galendromus occidentalis]|uniref:Serine/threonine-protein kinase greatwall n=1 Tax=Galendromus occidentalis TaxID=34638 RepID=A0AAJ7PB00_9ACAR|nr:serine/threonine-protein kinase orb6-like [Galendromus occidentalis]